MKKSVVLALLVSVAVAIPILSSGLSFAEEIRLSTIVPDQTIVRGKDGAIGNSYRSKTDADVPDGNLLVEGNVGIGTTDPGTSKLKVAGTIESTSGGIKFPDATVQMASAEFGNYGTVITLTTPVATIEANEVNVTQAATNLLVVATCVSGATDVTVIFKGYTGTTSNPTTLRGVMSAFCGWGHTMYSGGSFTMFVKKNEYYKITGWANSGQNENLTRTYCTIPIGN